jgi:hypothetical protein
MKGKKQFLIWLNIEEHKQLKMIAAQKETSIAAIVTELIRQYLTTQQTTLNNNENNNTSNAS